MGLDPNAKITIAIDIDVSELPRVPDDRLAMLWHVAQHNPAAFGDKQAGDLVQKISWEIIRRWLASTPPALYHHQARHYHWHQLGRFASYRDGDWRPDPDKLARYNTEQGAAEDSCPQSAGGHYFKSAELSDSPSVCVYCELPEHQGGGA